MYAAKKIFMALLLMSSTGIGLIAGHRDGKQKAVSKDISAGGLRVVHEHRLGFMETVSHVAERLKKSFTSSKDVTCNSGEAGGTKTGSTFSDKAQVESNKDGHKHGKNKVSAKAPIDSSTRYIPESSLLMAHAAEATSNNKFLLIGAVIIGLPLLLGLVFTCLCWSRSIFWEESGAKSSFQKGVRKARAARNLMMHHTRKEQDGNISDASHFSDCPDPLKRLQHEKDDSSTGEDKDASCSHQPPHQKGGSHRLEVPGKAAPKRPSSPQRSADGAKA